MPNENPLAYQIDQLIKNSSVTDGSAVGISIRSAKTGELIYEHGGNQRLRPASNMKLLTAAAALSILGENYRFSTELVTDGKISGNIIEGNLYLKGSGDPTLLPSNMEDFAKTLHDKGITNVDGNVIADDTWYDDVRYSPDLIWSDEHTYYGAQISALSISPDFDYDAGTAIIHVAPSSVGKKPRVTVEPANNYLSILNNSRTIDEDDEEELNIYREHGKNVIKIEGTIAVDNPGEREWISVWDPTAYAFHMFQRALGQQAISWSGEIKQSGAPENTQVLHTHESMPLSQLIIPFMKLSNNTHAEVLIKELGKVIKDKGSWDAGLDVLKSEVVKLGISTEHSVIRDGSGISHINLLRANDITNLLYSVQNEPWFHAFRDALPVAGEEDRKIGGTLRYRMKDLMIEGRVKAKTGTISTVSSLSGYIEREDKENIIFSFLINNVVDEDKAKELEDKLVFLLVEYY
ncbi:D-alanyl-D-alanine carboxypeptidase/D-alanyl-D-alanine-endopeptidase (penicillin-binding protein 4) [Aquibacillus albus]|uniref:D-alanyl-D-alanine carboxypeptidase/D-alanyl-D-alanine-endopeptidase (Penicillin-binding protein 4) n=1 Tax=Aquibacillus albus TaxID=1168171 RepID=A0ABS2N5N3_9BACI|nr:D-alanyl-D-alanine carboxypeptidase/D-alanyl-D-alanine-endopeptidase (penicillin-binding protein 4) [Aquibacillus albus]